MEKNKKRATGFAVVCSHLCKELCLKLKNINSPKLGLCIDSRVLIFFFVFPAQNPVFASEKNQVKFGSKQV